MLEFLIEAILAVLLYAGLPALFVFFVLKGALIGKPLPTTVLLPGYMLVISASTVQMIGIILVSSTGYVIGQMIIYYLARREGLTSIQSSSRISISSNQINTANRWFQRYGGIGVFITNFVPYLRGLIIVPAGMAHYPVPHLVFFVFSSTLIYHTLIVIVALSTVRMIF